MKVLEHIVKQAEMTTENTVEVQLVMKKHLNRLMKNMIVSVIMVTTEIMTTAHQKKITDLTARTAINQNLTNCIPKNHQRLKRKRNPKKIKKLKNLRKARKN